MPTYEYECEDCGKVWETEQSIKSEPESTCPECLKVSKKRLISGGTSFQLRGGGWSAQGYK